MSPESENRHLHGTFDMYDMSKTRVAFMMCVTTGRRGAEKDIEVMNKWFDKYQFETPSGQSLEEFRDQINQSEDEISCCLITLMSHGRSHGLIQGKDGDKVDLDDIFALFNNIQCPKLQEKPKIFIIQACRGGKEDHGVEEIKHEFKEADCTCNLIAIKRLPIASDYYVVYSTQKGKRDEAKLGRSYIHELWLIPVGGCVRECRIWPFINAISD
uniref:Caspase family p20 domain-containing protein n=1 Tax=Chelonoidis abingdonii TaxID=106734 RepID=A0A8C0H2W4_CHEAB